MNTSSMSLDSGNIHQDHYELRFQSLFSEGRALSFPCDSTGHVFLDDLSSRAMENYLYARAVVGREYATPAVVCSDNPPPAKKVTH